MEVEGSWTRPAGDLADKQRAARTRAERRFGLSRMVDAYFDVIRQALET